MTVQDLIDPRCILKRPLAVAPVSKRALQVMPFTFTSTTGWRTFSPSWVAVNTTLPLFVVLGPAVVERSQMASDARLRH